MFTYCLACMVRDAVEGEGWWGGGGGGAGQERWDVKNLSWTLSDTDHAAVRHP